MIFGKPAKLFRNRIELSKDLLRPLGIQSSARVSGFIYPRPQGDNYDHLSLDIDLAITPIPFRLWCYQARLSVYLLHKNGVLHRLTSILKANRVNILRANIVRFGHRYAEWDMIVDLSRFMDTLGEMGEREAGFETMQTVTQELISKIEANNMAGGETGDFLFEELEGPDKKISGTPIYLLHDHYKKIWEAEKVRRSSGEPSVQHARFDGTCKDHTIEFSSDRWEDALSLSGLRDQGLDSDEAYLHCIGAFDSESVTLRVVVIPEHLRRRFFRLEIPFSRNSLGDGSGTQGVLLHIADSLKEFNIWWTESLITKNTERFEEGSITMLVEITGGQADEEALRIARDGACARISGRPNDKTDLAPSENVSFGEVVATVLEAPGENSSRDS